MCLKELGLDPCNYYTTAGIAGDAMYKFSGAEIELISNEGMYNHIMDAVCGGISMISHRFAQANNVELKKSGLYDESKENSYILYLDANSLYPSAIVQPLPTEGFK